MTHSQEQAFSRDAQTLTDLLIERRGSRVDPIRFVRDVRRGFAQRAEASSLVDRAKLFADAARTAKALADRGVSAGARVVLLVPDPRDFVRCFFACQLLGAVPVPLVPPWSLARMQAHVLRIVAVVRVCKPQVMIATPDTLAAIRTFAGSSGHELSFGRLATPAELDSQDELATFHRAKSEDTALIQFTSGSTKEPRGVELSHRALLANCRAIGEELGFDQPGHLGCSWLPLFHDMGLIGHVLVPLLWSIPTVLMPPESFALRPASWLEAISDFGATISTAPNFAYQLAATRLDEEKTRGLDLSRWKVALCGGEPVLSASLRKFAERYSSLGFDERALCPVYGLAEATLAVSLSRPGESVLTERIDRATFSEHGQALPIEEPTVPALELVSCGHVARRHELEIRDAEGVKLEDGKEGDIWVSGPSLMTGYLDDPQSTHHCLQHGWLKTGDRGYTRAGELFVTGRSKELIVKGGRNLYPQELEAAVGQLTGIREGRVAAFGIPDVVEGTERLVIAAEYQRGAEPGLKLERAVLEAATTASGIRPDEVVLLPPGTLSKTSSGKMQRLDAQRRYLEEELEKPDSHLWDGARFLLARIAVRLEKR